MRKTILVIISIFIVILCVVLVKFKTAEQEKLEAKKFNSIYEEYNKDKLNGLDITTVINKAINNNEKYGIDKDENKMYINDNEYCVKIYIKMIINNKIYSMERINEVGMDSFIENFGIIGFKCTDIKYHENGRVSEMTFEATEY